MRPRFQAPVGDGVGVHEVKTLLLHPRKKLASGGGIDGVPAHVRKARCIEFFDNAWPLGKTRGIHTVFHTAIKHHLQAHTNTEDRPATGEAAFDNFASALCR